MPSFYSAYRNLSSVAAHIGCSCEDTILQPSIILPSSPSKCCPSIPPPCMFLSSDAPKHSASALPLPPPSPGDASLLSPLPPSLCHDCTPPPPGKPPSLPREGDVLVPHIDPAAPHTSAGARVAPLPCRRLPTSSHTPLSSATSLPSARLGGGSAPTDHVHTNRRPPVPHSG
eukprot:EG_transcript_18073